jgi:hypothetical protein
MEEIAYFFASNGIEVEALDNSSITGWDTG